MIAQSQNTAPDVIDPDAPQVPEEIHDPAGVVGMLAGIAAMACWLLGVMIPVLPWLLAGVFGLVALVCVPFARAPLRWWVLLIGVLSFIPPLAFIAVVGLPTIQNW
jgi:hypothetical protein